MKLLTVALLLVGIVKSQVLQSCRWKAYSQEASNSAIPTYVVNLDDPAEERWNHVVIPRKAQMEKFVKYVKGFLPSVLDYFISSWLESAVHRLPHPYGAEIIGMAKTLNLPIGDMMAVNIFYELEKLCTSIVARDSKGEIFHARNMDLGALMGWDVKHSTWTIAELLKPLTVNIDFTRNGKLVYRTVQFAGTVGVFTGVVPGKFSFSLNSRSSDEVLGGPRSILNWLTGPENNRFASLWARTVMDTAQSYEEAKHMLSTEPILAPVYYVLAGTSKNEGIVITRSKSKSILPFELSLDNWYILQTNYDHWNKPPFYDDRRTPANACLNEIANGVRKSDMSTSLYNILSTVPIKNEATIYTAIMSAKTGYIESNKRNCPGICYPW